MPEFLVRCSTVKLGMLRRMRDLVRGAAPNGRLLGFDFQDGAFVEFGKPKAGVGHPKGVQDVHVEVVDAAIFPGNIQAEMPAGLEVIVHVAEQHERDVDAPVGVSLAHVGGPEQ